MGRFLCTCAKNVLVHDHQVRRCHHKTTFVSRTLISFREDTKTTVRDGRCVKAVDELQPGRPWMLTARWRGESAPLGASSVQLSVRWNLIFYENVFTIKSVNITHIILGCKFKNTVNRKVLYGHTKNVFYIIIILYHYYYYCKFYL